MKKVILALVAAACFWGFVRGLIWLLDAACNVPAPSAPLRYRPKRAARPPGGGARRPGQAVAVGAPGRAGPAAPAGAAGVEGDFSGELYIL
jgi:hypothetical protein